MPCHHTTSFATDSNKSANALIVDTPAIIYTACASSHTGHQSGLKKLYFIVLELVHPHYNCFNPVSRLKSFANG